MNPGAGGPRFARPCFFSLLLLAAPAAAAPKDEALTRSAELRLWEAPAWIRLGHWKKTLFGAWVSDAKREGFFLSPRGRTDPRAELEAFLAALFEPDPGAQPQHARCLFPARTEFAVARLGLDLDAIPRADCSRFEDWKKLMAPTSVSLIFASAYMNNPASMFGHTFLRLERKGESDPRLLDNTLNFAAETGEDGGMLFAVKGLVGLYPGKYTVAPYYMKVQEYNNIESRDLWEYRLALTREETDRLAAHAWEMGPAEFPYYFFSKNCSYQLMPALDAAAPTRPELLPGTPAIVGPVDTLRAALASPGLIASVRYRPAHATTMRQRRSLLDAPERAAAEDFVRGRFAAGDVKLAALPEERRGVVLDAAQDYILYKEGFSPDAPEKVRAHEREILVRRARAPGKLEDPPAPRWAIPPDEQHKRKRLIVGGGARRGSGFADIAWRPGYHDLLDSPRGYVPGAQIYGFATRLRYDGERRKLHLREFTVVEVLSTSPWDPWMRKPSWTVGTGLETAYEKGQSPERSLIYEGHLGTGVAGEAGPVQAWGLVVSEGGAGPVLREGWRIGGSLRLGLAADLAPRWRALVEGALSGYAFGDRTPNHRLRAGLNWAAARDFALRAEGGLRGAHREAGLYAAIYH